MYCIVSNDCDFTRLAQELREQDKYVIGMGEQSKSIEEFVKAFSEYIYLDESMENEKSDDIQIDEGKASAEEDNTDKLVLNENTKDLTLLKIIGEEKMNYLVEIIREIIDEKGLALYCAINGPMKNKYPDFVPQNFNCKNFRQLMEILLPYLKQFEKIKTNDDYALVQKKKN